MNFVTSIIKRLDGLRRKAKVPLSRNDLRLLALKDLHRGQRAFIIGNGPSLDASDLDRLEDEVSFACNKIYLAYDDTAWRPTYYTIYDLLVAKNNRSTINQVVEKKIFRKAVYREFPDRPEIIYVDDLSLPSVDEGAPFRFSTNLLSGAYGGWTTIYFQLQLAYFMGIREAYLIGLDFHFESPEATERTTEHGEPVLLGQGEVNHFHPDYRAPGETWTKPELGFQRRAFQAAREVFEQAGGLLGNASRRTALDVLPRIDFDSLFDSPSAS